MSVSLTALERLFWQLGCALVDVGEAAVVERLK